MGLCASAPLEAEARTPAGLQVPCTGSAAVTPPSACHDTSEAHNGTCDAVSGAVSPARLAHDKGASLSEGHLQHGLLPGDGPQPRSGTLNDDVTVGNCDSLLSDGKQAALGADVTSAPLQSRCCGELPLPAAQQQQLLQELQPSKEPETLQMQPQPGQQPLEPPLSEQKEQSPPLQQGDSPPVNLAAAGDAADEVGSPVERTPGSYTYTAAAPPAQSALAGSSNGGSGGGGRTQSGARSVKFAEPPPDDDGDAPTRARTSEPGGAGTPRRGGPPRRSQSQGLLQARSSSNSGTPGEELSEAVLAKQVEILRSNKLGKLRQRRGGLDSNFAAMQGALSVNEQPLPHVNTRAAGLKHIGFGPFKRENQDEFFIQVGDFGGLHSSNLFCVFDGHGTHGKDAALYSRQLLPRLLDVELGKYFQRAGDSDEGLKGAVEVLVTEVFGETERSLAKFGVNLASSGTTATVTYQQGSRLWVASVGDSRAILCMRNARDQWRALPLTVDHRPRRQSERERIEAAGARVAPKRLPSGRTVGEPRMWLQNSSGPGLLLSRSLGDLTAATVGCTSDPEISYTTLRPGTDHVLVMASDGVWDVLTNEQVCDIVVESPDPHIACRRVLDAALYEWEERMSADNITVLVVEFDWSSEDGSIQHNVASSSTGGAEAAPVQQQQQDALPQDAQA